MYTYVARQAIFDRKKHVYAYELLFRDGTSNCYPDIAPDEATSKLLTNSHLNLGLDEITNGKPAFINFFQDTLLYRFPTFLDPESVVVEVLENIDISQPILDACQQIKNLGYKLALDDYNFDPKWDVFIPLVDIIKVDVRESDRFTIEDNMGKLKAYNVKLVAEKVETEDEFEFFHQLGFDLFQGYFFTRPQVIKNKSLPSSKLGVVELLAVSSSVEFDFARINSIIERDVSLSYRLLRFINNPMVNKRQKITSLRHALNYMGQIEIKKFIALLALANLNDNKPPELIHLSLVRAKFCELIADSKGEFNNPPMGFLVGLLSMLDALLDQEMAVLVNKLPISDELKQGLCGMEGRLNNYLNLVKALESANWQNVQQAAISLQINTDDIHDFHHQALIWGGAMRSMASD
ncbi:EAL and HDOD domain-containing protein [Neptunicella sp. SCSIO 80796]|uniref:EAL and HDOD domain-containing protein n=1 Tax=Neptunicella plasticusilytica TaxID=3117012 RepID=UPI003A4DECB5